MCKIFDIDSGTTRTLIKIDTGVVRDPEISFDGKKVVFSMRKNKEDDYHIYEIGLDGSGLKQLTSSKGVTDIDPLYLPDGGIVFTSTRAPVDLHHLFPALSGSGERRLRQKGGL